MISLLGSFCRSHPTLVQDKSLLAIVEHPLPDFLPVIESVREMGGTCLYDLIDAWDTLLGGNWYSPAGELRIIEKCQVLAATAPALVERLQKVAGRRVELLPNAVNSSLFNPARLHPRPADLPSGKWIGIYTGALWGDWFDWTLLECIAGIFSRGCVRHHRGLPRAVPTASSNLFFLGLKKQTDLPAYLAQAAVALIPWKNNALTNAASPLKVYEYLAMHLPVVAPRIAPLLNIPGVLLARDEDQFTAMVGRAAQMKLDLSQVDAFIAKNNWKQRVNDLIEITKTAQLLCIKIESQQVCYSLARRQGDFCMASRIPCSHMRIKTGK